MSIASVNPNLTTILFRFLTIEKESLAFLPEDYAKYLEYLPLFLLMFLLAFLLTPLIGHLAKKYNFLSLPAHMRQSGWNRYEDKSRHTHRKPVPLLGGLAVVAPFLIISTLIFTLQGDIVYLLIGIAILMISGLIDDKYNMPSVYQFSFQLLAALIMSFAVTNFEAIKIPLDGIISLGWETTEFTFLGNPASFSFPGDILMMVWILGVINAIKWTAGVDALMEGNLLIIFGLMYTLAIRTGNIVVAVVTAMLAGGILGFGIFNFPPAKIYSGSIGKTVYGFVAASLAVIGSTKLATFTLILLLPLADAAYVILRRYIKYRPKNPAELLRFNGRDHLHHQLEDMGLSRKQILLVETSITLLLGSIATLTTAAYRYFLVLFLAFLLLAGIATIHFMRTKVVRKKEVKKERDTPESKYSY